MLHKQLIRRKHLTRMLLWQEYPEQHGDGYSYSQFCERYRAWKSRRDPVMWQEHKAGERLFVDYVGQMVAIEQAATGESREAVIFVATLGEFIFLRRSQLGLGRGKLDPLAGACLRGLWRGAGGVGAGLCATGHNPDYDQQPRSDVELSGSGSSAPNGDAIRTPRA